MNIRLYFHTIRHLKLQQTIGKVWFRMRRPRPDMRPAPDRREYRQQWSLAVEKYSSMMGPGRFTFLNEQHELIDSGCWNHSAWSKLWLYNLHYFDDLNARGAGKRQEWHHALVGRWIRENSPGQGVGWDPYPVSLRIVNWIKWTLAGYALGAEAVYSLAVQARWLTRRMEYHLLGNHLLVNAKALVFAGLFFKGREPDEWLADGERILEQEIPEQVLADGGHFERSPMYHLLVLEDLLDLFNLYRVFGRPFPSHWRDTIDRMLNWSFVMRHPDGEIPLFNDAAIGIAPTPGRLDDYAAELGFRPPASVEGRLLEQSEFVRLQSKSVRIFLDIGSVAPDYLPAHAHAGTLSFELSLGRQRIFVNSGTSLYEPGLERERQRSTAAHNTVQVDGQNSSEVWASFRVARRARVKEQSVEINARASVVIATHDGYARLKSPVMHRREWRLEEESMEITDHLLGRGQHHLRIFFMLHPEVNVVKDAQGFHLSAADSAFSVIFQPDITLQAALEEGMYHPEFGLSMPTRMIVCTQQLELPQSLIHRIQWTEG